MRYITSLYLRYFLRKLPKTVEICLKKSRPGQYFFLWVYIGTLKISSSPFPIFFTDYEFLKTHYTNNFSKAVIRLKFHQNVYLVLTLPCLGRCLERKINHTALYRGPTQWAFLEISFAILKRPIYQKEFSQLRLKFH